MISLSKQMGGGGGELPGSLALGSPERRWNIPAQLDELLLLADLFESLPVPLYKEGFLRLSFTTRSFPPPPPPAFFF